MFKLNTQRIYQHPVSVTIYDEAGKEQTGTFKATFRVVPHNEMREMDEDVSLLDAVLVKVDDIEVPGPDGQPLAGDELLNAVKQDPATSMALVASYQQSIAKKNRPRS